MVGSFVFLKVMQSLRLMRVACSMIAIGRLGAIVSDILCFALVFVAWDFLFLFREANCTAHTFVALSLHQFTGASL